jgi:hypothetical protein
MKAPSKRQAMREAKHYAAGEIQTYLDAGQPSFDHECDEGQGPCSGCRVVREALTELSIKLERESGRELLSGHWWQKRDPDGKRVRS